MKSVCCQSDRLDRAVLGTGRNTDELYHGSWLGRWLVYWIVHRYGGSIAAEEEGDGTVVEIRLSRPGEQ